MSEKISLDSSVLFYIIIVYFKKLSYICHGNSQLYL